MPTRRAPVAPDAIATLVASSSPIPAGPRKFLRFESVVERVPFSKASLYRLIEAGKFPEPIPLGGGRAVAWLESEVDAWIAHRIAQRTTTPRRKTRTNTPKAKAPAAEDPTGGR